MPKPKTILLVDDNPLVLTLIGKALAKEGFGCFKAESAKEAMLLLKKEIPDLILSDYQMPEINGFEFRETLLAAADYKNIPFMFLTSMADNDLMLKGINMDAIDYIIKDTPVPVIISKINNYLNSIREQHERTIQELSSAALALNLYSVPQKPPIIKGMDVDFWHKPYQNYPGGDFIDFINVDNRYTFIILGDVMGKKWGAWFFSFGYLSYIRAAVRLCISDGDISTQSIMQKINTVIYHDPVVSEVLSTLSLIMIDNETSTISYTGAGDLPLIYYDNKHKKVSRITSNGLLLGIMLDGGFNEYLFPFNAGDQLVLITDGLIDQETAEGKKTDYDAFANDISAFLGQIDSFNNLKNNGFLDKKAFEQIDDCSLIFLQKTTDDIIN